MRLRHGAIPALVLLTSCSYDLAAINIATLKLPVGRAPIGITERSRARRVSFSRMAAARRIPESSAISADPLTRHPHLR